VALFRPLLDSMQHASTKAVTITATVSGQGLSPTIPITISGNTGTAQISAASGTLDLLACSDSACAHQLGNSPVAIQYTVTVNGLLVAPRQYRPLLSIKRLRRLYPHPLPLLRISAQLYNDIGEFQQLAELLTQYLRGP